LISQIEFKQNKKVRMTTTRSYDSVKRLTAALASQTRSGGDESGAGLRPANYSVNNRNQYSQRDVPGYVDVLGAALSSSTVTVNGESVYRKAEYFRKELTVDNNSAAVWQALSVTATERGRSRRTAYFFPQFGQMCNSAATPFCRPER